MKRNLYIVVFIFLTLTFLSCENNIETVNSLTGKDKLPTESATNIELVFSDSAKTKVKLTAPVFDHYSDKADPYYELPKGVNLVFYDENMNPKTRLTARYAIRRERDTTMIVRNKVVVINENGEKLETEELTWNEAKREIHTNSRVTITKKDQILFGKGLKSNESFTDYEILEPEFENTIYLDDEKNVPNK